jgi:septal ring factor EnvC (AmiA/AmiB activator)
MSEDNSIEYGGIKLTGSKLLLIIPILSTVSGALWAGFELYNRLLKAEDALNSIDPPAITAEIKRMESVYTLIKEDVTKQIQQVKEANEKDISRLRTDIDIIEDRNAEMSAIVKKTESELATAERELRDDVYAMERQMQEAFKESDNNVRLIRSDIEKKITEILTNPLNNSGK